MNTKQSYRRPANIDEQRDARCSTCVECVRTYLGCYCGLTDNMIDEAQEACVDYINEEEEEVIYGHE